MMGDNLANCDMCGNKIASYNAEIEGVELQVCIECGKHGKIRSAIKPPETEKKKIQKRSYEKPEIIEVIVSDFYDKIKNKREKMGLKQREFAKAINEKDSLIHNIETGKFKPNIELANKISRFLKIDLVESYQEKKPDVEPKSNDDDMTLKDYIKIKK